jgi:integrase
MLKARKSGFDFLTFDECERFLAAAREHVPAWFPYMVGGARTGLRVGEMLALVGARTSTSTKNDKSREIPLTWDAREALAVQCTRSQGELVFPMDDVKAKDTMVNHWIEDVCEAAGLRRIHSHVLRHTFASHAIMRGVPIRQVQEWLGHGSIVETMRYAHLAEGHGDELIKLLAPQPTPERGGRSRKRAARPQHTSTTQHTAPMETPPQPG